jgi:hypothetical protein
MAAGEGFVLSCPPCCDQVPAEPHRSDDERTVAVLDERIVLSSAPNAESVQVRARLREAPEGDPVPGSEEASTDPPPIRVDAGEWQLDVSRNLLAGGPPFAVEVVVELLGDRDADTARIAAVHALLDRHKGPVPSRLVLQRSSFRRVVERGLARGVSYSAALEGEAAELLGPGSLTLRLDSSTGGS